MSEGGCRNGAATTGGIMCRAKIEAAEGARTGEELVPRRSLSWGGAHTGACEEFVAAAMRGA
jgi:hypothetical protein